eukprot:TRINITY_DN24607_c0_g1_i1.p1 TRINITY_DN24607_c0_g1~~TRINITY_DN24607_c0_g1_i1.p1  ORF type:complete len:699 (+),score=146.64 TRINITY_DN24607_c0_g1_i1:86-2098(+)
MSLLGSFSKKPKGSMLSQDEEPLSPHDDDDTGGGGRLLDRTDEKAREMPFKIGDRVRAKLPKQQCYENGTVLWIGKPDFLPGTGLWVGIELDHPLGTHGGTVNKREYFRCRDCHGVIVRLHQVSFETDPLPPDDPFAQNSRTETLHIPYRDASEISWVDKDGDTICFRTEGGRMYYTLNGSPRPPFRQLRWLWTKAKGNDPGWIEMPDIGKQFAMPRQGLAENLGALREMAKQSGVECSIGDRVSVRLPPDASDTDVFNTASFGSDSGAVAAASAAVSDHQLQLAGQQRTSPPPPQVAPTTAGPIAPPAAAVQRTSSSRRAAPVRAAPGGARAPEAAGGISPPTQAAVASPVVSPPTQAAAPPAAHAVAAAAAEMAALESRKADAVRREDYAEAMRLKAEMDTLRARTAQQAQQHVDAAAPRGRSHGSIDFDDFAATRSSNQLNVAPTPPAGLPQPASTPGNTSVATSSNLQVPANTPICPAPPAALSTATVPLGNGNVSFSHMDASAAGPPGSLCGSPPGYPPPANTPTYTYAVGNATVPENQAVFFTQSGNSFMGQAPGSESPMDSARPGPPVNSPLYASPQHSGLGQPGGGVALNIHPAQFTAPPAAVTAQASVSPPSSSAMPQMQSMQGSMFQPLPAAAVPGVSPTSPPTKHRSQASLDFEHLFGK